MLEQTKNKDKGCAMREDGKIDYVEFPATGLPATKAFYAAAFGWAFTDYGPDYAAFEGEGTDGGFASDPESAPAKPLVVLYAQDLEAMEAKVHAAGGQVTRPIFAFPGGRRFHFQDPSGNELAVWSER
jgi:predicted enzyme related to lactoylglutathione lyase